MESVVSCWFLPDSDPEGSVLCMACYVQSTDDHYPAGEYAMTPFSFEKGGKKFQKQRNQKKRMD